jgi:hypothetical protein
MLTLSQRVPNGATKIGKTNRTLAEVGCTITCIAMSSSYFGEYKTNKELASALRFTADAKIIWASIGEVFKRFEFRWRFYSNDRKFIDDNRIIIENTRISEAIKNPDKTVLLNVDHGGHWVLAIRRLYGDTYWVADPWTGTRKIYSGVVGGAVLVRKR